MRHTDAHQHVQAELLDQKNELADVSAASEVEVAAALLVVDPEHVRVDHG